MDSQISNEALFNAYRHAKALFMAIETELVKRGLIPCPRCKMKHPDTKPCRYDA